MSIDKHSPTWAAVSAEIRERLEEYTEDLMSQNTDWDKTQYLRGQIATLQELLALPDSAGN